MSQTLFLESFYPSPLMSPPLSLCITRIWPACWSQRPASFWSALWETVSQIYPFMCTHMTLLEPVWPPCWPVPRLGLTWWMWLWVFIMFVLHILHVTYRQGPLNVLFLRCIYNIIFKSLWEVLNLHHYHKTIQSSTNYLEKLMKVRTFCN